MSRAQLIVLAMLAFFLGGCASTHTTATKVEYIYVRPSATMTERILVPMPPDREQYMQLDWTSREKLLTDYSISLMKGLNQCNTRIDAIRSYDPEKESLSK